MPSAASRVPLTSRPPYPPPPPIDCARIPPEFSPVVRMLSNDAATTSAPAPAAPPLPNVYDDFTPVLVIFPDALTPPEPPPPPIDCAVMPTELSPTVEICV